MSEQQLSEFFRNLRDRCITVQENSISARDIFLFKKRYDLGYCYYNLEDAEDAIETGVLRLHWGSYSSDQFDELVIANAIVDEAKFCEMDVKWSGFSDDDIILSNVDSTYFRN